MTLPMLLSMSGFQTQLTSKVTGEQEDKTLPPCILLPTYSESLGLKTCPLPPVWSRWLRRHFTGLWEGVGRVGQRFENKRKQIIKKEKVMITH